MNVQVLGAGLDVGRSCLLLTIANRQLLLDCGAHHGFADNRRFPDFSSLPPQTLSNLDAILITHFHFDHAAALPFLACVHDCKAPIYMTSPTSHLAKLMLQDFLSTSPSRCPFSDTDVHTTLSRVKPLSLNTPIEIPPISSASSSNANKIVVTAYQAGHTLGAVMLHVRAGSQTLLYSGDYSVRPDRVIPTAAVPSRLQPHLFITEATYCSSVRSFNDDTDMDMTAAVFKTLSKRGKVLFPVSAFGRVHSLCASLSKLAGQFPLHEVPAYVVSGTTTKALSTYNRFSDWTVETQAERSDRSAAGLSDPLQASNPKFPTDHPESDDNNENDNELENNKQTGPRKRSRSTGPCSNVLLNNLRPFNRTHDWHVIDGPGPVILFATPANLSTGISRQVFQTWCTQPDNLVVMPSASFTTSVAANNTNASSSSLQNGGASGPNVRCKIVNSLSACHPDSTDILRMIRHVDPKSVMLVHGEQTKVLAFRERVKDIFKMPCFAPENGESVEVPADILSTPAPSREDEEYFELPRALSELANEESFTKPASNDTNNSDNNLTENNLMASSNPSETEAEPSFSNAQQKAIDLKPVTSVDIVNHEAVF